jgi:predicted small integral membrane protein
MTSNMLRGFDWEGAGRETGERLGAYHAIVVVGADPVSTGRVAIGIARAQAGHRRVAVGDLFAESWPIQELVQTDDPHGLVDSFLYGVSLTRIAYEVKGAGQLYVMPSGTEPPDYDEIFPNPRWHRLAAGFREVNALLVLAAPARAPHIEDLVAATDGAILVGEVVPAALPAARVIGAVREPVPQQRLTPPSTTGQTPVRSQLELATAGTAATESKWTRGRIAAFAGIALTAVLAIMAYWLASRPFADSRNGSIVGRHDTTHGASPVLSSLDSARDTGVVVPAPPVPIVANPVDSAGASAFAVQLVVINTQAGAILKLQTERKDLPAATFTPTMTSSGQWFEFVSGAFEDQKDADSLLADLGRRRMLLAGSKVVRRPYAFLIDSGRPAAAVPGMVAAYVDRGQPVYALRQSNGTAWLLMGAYESPEKAASYVESLRASGITPVLVYRKGRAF